MHCTTDRQAAAPLLVLPRRFATESAREEARMFCDELMAARTGWVERSDTHQLHLMEMMGFAGSTHPTS
jgi:hypothetical protein